MSALTEFEREYFEQLKANHGHLYGICQECRKPTHAQYICAHCSDSKGDYEQVGELDL